MDWTVIFSLPGLLVIGTIYFFILWIKRYFDDKRTRKYLFERNQQLEKEVKEKNAREKEMFFRENPGKSLSDFNELQKKALLERMIEFNEQSKKKDEEIEFSTPEFQPPKKRIFGPLITKDEWKETSFLHKIWIVFVLAGVTALIFLYLKEIVLFIAAVAVSVIAIIALIIISQFFH